MKVVCLLGSPSVKGSSATLAGRFVEEAVKSGAKAETIVLNELVYKGCQACYACKGHSESCVVNDDLKGVLEKVFDADVLVLASPVYYGDVSSQMKGFIDRTFSFLKPDFFSVPEPCRLAPGKKLLFILVQADGNDGNFNDIFPRYASFFRFYGYADVRLVRGVGIGAPAQLAERENLFEEVVQAAREMCKKESIMEHLDEAVLKAMKEAGKPVRPGEIAKLLQKDSKEISKAIKKLKEEGKIHSPKRCYYAPSP